MTFKKLCSAVLAAAMVLALGLPASAATSSAAGSLVDENGYIVDRDTLSPGGTYYYIIGNTAQYGILTDKSYVNFSLKKTSNSKYITDADLMEKRFGGDRMVCIRLVVRDYFTDDEYKVQMEASFRARVDLDIQNRADVAAGRAFPQFVPKSNAPVTYAARSTATDDYNRAADALEKAKQTLDTLNAELAVLASKLGKIAPYAPDYVQAAAAEKTYQDAIAKVQILSAQVNQQAESVRLLQNNPNSGTLPPEKVAQLTTAKNDLAAQIEGVKAHLRALGIVPDTYIPSADPLDAQKLLPYYDPAVARASVVDSGSPPPQSFTNWNAYRANYLISYPGDATAIPALAKGNFSYPDPITGLPKPYFDNRSTVQASLVNLITSLKNTIGNANAQIATINSQLSGAIPMAYSANPALDAARNELVRLQSLKSVADNDAAAANIKAVNYKDFNSKAIDLTSKKDAVTIQQALFDNAKKVLDAETSTTPGIAFLNAGQTFTHYFTIWVGNESVSGDDTDFDVGQSGQVVRPVKGAVNTIRWNDGYGTIASVRFTADSDASFFCPRLSTRWDSADYYDYFDGQDAYLFDFVSNPTLPATSRAELQLRNPFVDENGRSTVKSRDIMVYQIVNGSLKDVTGLFYPTVNDDGVSVLSTRTRTLGTYVVCEEEVWIDDGYDDDDDYNDDDVEVLDPSVPIIPAIDITNNQKPVPNTGR